MHLDHNHSVGPQDHGHDHEHPMTHEEMHAMGIAHEHEHDHVHEHPHDHDHPHDHPHDHEHGCAHECGSCASSCEHTPMEELLALMQYMVGHNSAHARELADLAVQLDHAGNHMAYEQVMAAVSDFEKGNLRLSAVLSGLKG